MNKKLTYTLITGILILGMGLFYWYEWRPSEIRKKCVEIAKKEAIESLYLKAELLTDKGNYLESKEYREIADKDMFLKDDYSAKYDMCLKEKGLNK